MHKYSYLGISSIIKKMLSMIKLKELTKKLNDIYDEIFISEKPIFNSSVAIKLKIQTKNLLAKTEMIYKQLLIYFPGQIGLREDIISKNRRIICALNENLLRSETIKKSALVYLKLNFHYLSYNKYKYHIIEYFGKEINDIFKDVSYISFNKYTQQKGIDPEEILVEIYKQNLFEIKEMLKEKRKGLSIKNIKTIFAIYGHKFSVFIYLFSLFFIFLHGSQINNQFQSLHI